MYSKMAELLEDRENGDWKLEKFVIDNDNFMARIQGIMPGTYVRLLCKGECVMSDFVLMLMEMFYIMQE